MAGTQRPSRFRPGELDAADLGPSAQAELLRTARELEWLAAAEGVDPAADFTDRVMAAVRREPAPRPLAAALGAARRRSPIAALSALGDLWRVAFTGGRPFAVRLPAMALVALLVLGSITTGALGAGALAGFLGRTPDATPALSSSPVEFSASPSPSASPLETESPEPSGQPGSSESPEPSDTLKPTDASAQTPAATEDGSAHPSATPRPTSHSTQAPDATETPKPGETPQPTETPAATSEPGGGSGGG